MSDHFNPEAAIPPAPTVALLLVIKHYRIRAKLPKQHQPARRNPKLTDRGSLYCTIEPEIQKGLPVRELASRMHQQVCSLRWATIPQEARAAIRLGKTILYLR